MDIHDIVTTDSDESLKCFACGNYLSYFPISLCSNHQNICGRCQIPEGTFSFENEAFETVCQGLKFPCRYNSEGCWAKLFPEDVPKHEETCQYKPVLCVISKPNQCQWRGPSTLLSNHFQEEHSDIFRTDGEFELDLSNSDDCDSLLEFQNRTLVFSLKFDCNSKVLQCSVYSNQYEFNMVEYKCCLTLKSHDTTVTRNFQSSLSSKKYLVELSLLILSNCSTRISGKITITRDAQPELPDEVNQQLISLLQCSSSMNHSLECKSCNMECPSIESLEKLSNLVHYPCQFKENGCSLSLHKSELLLHIENCEYKPVKCLLLKYKDACKWSGKNQELVDHILNKHLAVVHSNYRRNELNWNDSSRRCCFIKFSNRLFRLTYWTNETRFFCGIEAIRKFEEKFMYEVEIVDRTEKGQKLLVRQPCVLIRMGHDIPLEYSYFEKEQIRSFVKCVDMKDTDLCCVEFKVRVCDIH